MSEEHGQVVEALGYLGRLDDIPAYLAEHGHRGVSGETAACPVAVYVRDQTGNEVNIGALLWWFDGEAPNDSGGMLPRAVYRFVEQFDAGQYPQLDVIATPERTAPHENGEPTDG